jgi:hypothetical protein
VGGDHPRAKRHGTRAQPRLLDQHTHPPLPGIEG